MTDRLDELLKDDLPSIESLFEAEPNVQEVGLEHPPKFAGERHDLRCGECSAPMMLRESQKFPRPFYGCTRFPECRGTHGAHADGTPLGTPANKDTKKARIRAHSVFDQIWQQKLVKSRGGAYNWMRQVMGLSHSQAHIGEFDADQCEKLVELVYRDYPKLRDRHARLMYGKDLLEELGDDPGFDEPETDLQTGEPITDDGFGDLVKIEDYDVSDFG